MFRPIRRSAQQLPEAEARVLLEHGSWGVLSLAGDEGYPYGVPLNYCVAGDKLYFHSAKQGHKLDALAACPKACFTVVSEDRLVPEEYTTYFRSVVAFGTVRTLTDPEEITAAMLALSRRFVPQKGDTDHRRELERFRPALAVIEFTVQHFTGKESIELTRARDGEERSAYA